MTKSIFLPLAVIGVVGGAALATATVAPAVVMAPPPAIDVKTSAPREVAVLAGGCFWGVEGVYEKVRGVTSVISGYSGGARSTATYDLTSTGTTGHAEAVRIEFDPSKISYGRILQIYFSVVADPTQKNRQGPDTGPQYRSALFALSPAQGRVARAYLAQLSAARVYPRPIVTTIEPFKGFFAAESDHQNFMARNPTYPYIVAHDRPKVEALRRQFPSFWRG